MNGQSLNFDWDDANQNHLARHKVTPQEAEEVVLGDPLDIELQTAEGSGGEERILHVGETRKGRILERWKSSNPLRVGCTSAIQAGLSGRNEAALWEH